MNFESKPNTFDDLPQKVWAEPKKGLKKELKSFEFHSMKKLTTISKCLMKVDEIKNLNERESRYLNHENVEISIELSTALTPIDCYIELFLQQMFEGEESKCSIQTKSGDVITFSLKLLKIIFVKHFYELNLSEMFALARRLKDNGVHMFKKYPLFAQEYFSWAAKCLISFKPFDVLTESADGVDPKELEKLLENIQVNIAACLIRNNHRYDDILYLTEFLDNRTIDDNRTDSLDKAIYRRALAFYYLNKFSEAKILLEKFHFQDKTDFIQLYQKILTGWKKSEINYRNVVKKMFG